MLLLAILVRAIRGLLHLRVWEGKWHPREVVIRHCGRSAARRGRSFARSLGHRVGGRYIVVQGFRSGPQQMRCVRFHYAQWVVGTCCCWLSGAAPAVAMSKIEGRGQAGHVHNAMVDGPRSRQRSSWLAPRVARVNKAINSEPPGGAHARLSANLRCITCDSTCLVRRIAASLYIVSNCLRLLFPAGLSDCIAFPA